MSDLITSQKYLDGELTLKEKKKFESRLEHELVLNEELVLIKELDEVLGDKELLEFENKIRSLILEQKRIQKTIKNKYKLIFSGKFLIAASVILILGFLSYIYVISTKPDINKIYNQYYVKYDPDITKRSESLSENLFAKALEQYMDQNYEVAIRMFNEMIANEENKLLASFYSGLCCMELREYKKALNYFNAINNSDSIIQIHSEWYTALSYLKLNDINKSKELFVVLVREKGYYSEMANKILSDLK